ncbi:Meiotic recombination protein dmc1 [Orobanche hederae]
MKIVKIATGSQALDELLCDRRGLARCNFWYFVVTSNGINAGDVKKLQDAGIYTRNDLMILTKKILLDREEIDDEDDLFEMIDKHMYLSVTSNGINAGDVKKLQDANSHMNHTKTA